MTLTPMKAQLINLAIRKVDRYSEAIIVYVII